jgi:hypothetical protein
MSTVGHQKPAKTVGFMAFRAAKLSMPVSRVVVGVADYKRSDDHLVEVRHIVNRDRKRLPASAFLFPFPSSRFWT